MNELVRKLSEGNHPVEIVLRPERTLKALRECLVRRYVHVRFTATRGGTELGVPVDAELSDLSVMDRETGHLKVVGTLTLDYVRVRCVADFDLPSFEGYGHLEVVSESETPEVPTASA